MAAADDESRNAALLGGQLQAAALGEIECCDLADDGAQAVAAQGLFHRPERIRVAADGKVQQMRRIAARRRQGPCIEIALPGDPEERTRAALPGLTQQPGNDAGGKARFLAVEARPGEFMQCPQSKTTARQMPVDGRDAPGKNRGHLCDIRGQGPPLQPLNPAPERSQARPVGEGGYGVWLIHYSLFVLTLDGVKK
jgi:hypothetical protein